MDKELDFCTQLKQSAVYTAMVYNPTMTLTGVHIPHVDSRGAHHMVWDVQTWRVNHKIFRVRRRAYGYETIEKLLDRERIALDTGLEFYRIYVDGELDEGITVWVPAILYNQPGEAVTMQIKLRWGNFYTEKYEPVTEDPSNIINTMGWFTILWERLLTRGSTDPRQMRTQKLAMVEKKSDIVFATNTY